MAQEALELEGTWEEIMAHAAEFAGRRVQLLVLPGQPAPPERQKLSPTNQRMLELLADWERTPLSNEERAVLDELEQHLKEQPFSLRELGDTP